jgi:hypothetical protein
MTERIRLRLLSGRLGQRCFGRENGGAPLVVARHAFARDAGGIQLRVHLRFLGRGHCVEHGDDDLVGVLQLNQQGRHLVACMDGGARAALPGYSDKAIRRKIETGVWLQGKHYRKAPDGRITMNLQEYYAWVESA